MCLYQIDWSTARAKIGGVQEAEKDPSNWQRIGLLIYENA